MRVKLGLARMTLVAAAAAAASGLVATLPAAADSAAPEVAAWWNLQNQGIEPPAPQGVNSGDLFVEGAGGSSQVNSQVPASAPFPAGVGDKGAADAIAGLAFGIPKGAKVEKLTLFFDGAAPAKSSVEACRATAPFLAQTNGPWSNVPPYDCTIVALGTVATDNKSIVFNDIGALVKKDTLSVVLVPQYADREIWTKPGPDALAFTPPPPTFDTSTASQPFFATSTSASTGSNTSQFPTGGTVVPQLPAFNPSIPAVTTPAQAPAAAGAVPGASVSAPAVATVDPKVARIVAAIALLVALGLFALMLSADTTLWRRLFGARSAAALAARGHGPRGVGRFASVREGRPDSV